MKSTNYKQIRYETLLLRFARDGPLKVRSKWISQSASIPNAKDTENEQVVVGTVPFGTNAEKATDGTVVTSGKKNVFSMLSALRNNALNSSRKSLEDYLSRPIKIQSGTLAATDSPTTFTSYNVYTPAIADDMFADKLRGVYTFRATTVVTIQINATRFQQGRYILAFLPTCGSLATNYLMHRSTKCEITQLSHINMDINCETEGQLTIPHVSALPAFSWDTGTNGEGSPGLIFLYPYRPLESSAGSLTCDYSIWLHYIDIEIQGMSVSQGSWEAQMARGGKKGKDLLTKEVTTDRPLSTALSVVTEVASALSSVPLLSTIATPTSWITGALAKAAFTWGWSKPLLLEKPMRVVRLPFPYMGNSDAHDSSQPLSLTVNNHVDVVPGFASTDMDELSIDYIKSIPSWFNYFTWTTARASGYQLNSHIVSPFISFPLSDGYNDLLHHPPVSYLCYLFRYWRGSLTYTLKFTKTEFHSGRMAIYFYPCDEWTKVAPAFSTIRSEYAPKVIVDLRECNEITFSVPYVNNRNWSYTSSAKYATGWLYYVVLDPLVAPANVPTSVHVDIEIRGGADLEYSVPNADLTTSSGFNALTPVYPAIAQADFGDPCSEGDINIGNTISQNDSLIHHSACNGEVIPSLRPLIKRGGFMHIATTNTTGQNTTVMQPRMLSAYASTGIGTLTGIQALDPIGVIAPLYGIMRGGVRIRTLLQGSLGGGIMLQSLQTLVPGTPGNTTYQTSSSTTMPQFIYACGSGGAQHAVSLPSLGGMEVQVPQYHDTLSYSVNDCLTIGSTAAVGATGNGYRTQLRIWDGNSTVPPRYFYRSGADDFNLGCFISTCPTIATAAP